MNKLAILAFSLLIFLSAMLWYLANGSLNDYLKSQVELQGQYYSGQTTQLALANYSANTGRGVFNQFSLANISDYQEKYALVIDSAQIELAPAEQRLLTNIAKVSINKLTLNIEKKAGTNSNIEQLQAKIRLTLAQDYPEHYPALAAKIYAAKNPQLDAEAYAKSHPQSGAIIEHVKAKKKRAKAQGKIKITTLVINTLEVNTLDNGVVHTKQQRHVQLTNIGGINGLVTNQLGGEILLSLLHLAK